MLRGIDVGDTSATVPDDKKAVQQSERYRRLAVQDELFREAGLG
jgi:hypothetical protein